MRQFNYEIKRGFINILRQDLEDLKAKKLAVDGGMQEGDRRMIKLAIARAGCTGALLCKRNEITYADLSEMQNDLDALEDSALQIPLRDDSATMFPKFSDIFQDEQATNSAHVAPFINFDLIVEDGDTKTLLGGDNQAMTGSETTNLSEVEKPTSFKEGVQAVSDINKLLKKISRQSTGDMAWQHSLNMIEHMFVFVLPKPTSDHMTMNQNSTDTSSSNNIWLVDGSEIKPETQLRCMRDLLQIAETYMAIAMFMHGHTDAARMITVGCIWCIMDAVARIVVYNETTKIQIS
jgi:hypothetical protein